MIKALKYSIFKIMDNAKLENTQYLIEKLLNSDLKGYDIKKGEVITDMYTLDIVDPTQVLVNALKNSVASACTLLKSGVIIEDIDEK
jgi:chaperonin GroEL (HSP60 family)